MPGPLSPSARGRKAAGTGGTAPVASAVRVTPAAFRVRLHTPASHPVFSARRHGPVTGPSAAMNSPVTQEEWC
ncbi:hypothetical protein E1287_02545 [Actinomadura sp. KC06]|nr:hypothetical protein E1287_02545 [Actinomadura sp. KC06]